MLKFTSSISVKHLTLALVQSHHVIFYLMIRILGNIKKKPPIYVHEELTYLCSFKHRQQHGYHFYIWMNRNLRYRRTACKLHTNVVTPYSRCTACMVKYILRGDVILSCGIKHFPAACQLTVIPANNLNLWSYFHRRSFDTIGCLTQISASFI